MLNPMPSTTNEPGETAKPSPHLCPQCTHSNTPDSSFCSACGTPLPVTACPHCGAVNPAAAASCHQCHGELQDSGEDVLNSAAAAFETYKAPPRPPIPVVVWVAGGVILVTLGFLGYNAYQIFSYVDIPYERATPPAGESLLEGRGGPSYSGTIGRAPPAGDEPAEQNGRGAAVPVMPNSKAETAPAPPARTPADTRPLSRRTAEPCTEEAAAAGLCSPALKRATGVETSAKTETAVAPPPPKVVRKAAERAPAGAQPCTAGTWALGLCKSEPVQPKE